MKGRICLTKWSKSTFTKRLAHLARRALKSACQGDVSNSLQVSMGREISSGKCMWLRYGCERAGRIKQVERGPTSSAGTQMHTAHM